MLKWVSEVEAGADEKQQIKFRCVLINSRAACEMVLTGGDYGSLFSLGLLLLAIPLATIRGQQGI